MDLSIVIPIYNEEESLPPLVDEIFNSLEAAHITSFELILVDDGSKDTTWNVIQALAAKSTKIRALKLRNNKGQSAALQAGFAKAKGTFVATLDADGQNDPHDIGMVLDIAQKGNYDLVSGKRKKRKDSLMKRMISKSANYIRNSVLNDPSTDTGCSLKIFRRSSLSRIKLYRGMHRFLPALFAIEGFTCTEVTVNHRPRLKGTSKYSLFSRGFSLISDLLAVWWMKKRAITYAIEDSING